MVRIWHLSCWGDSYPTANYVTHDKIALIRRPPKVLWNLNDLKDSPTVKFYGRDYPVALPPSFTIRSLDLEVAFDQTIQLDWKKREKNTDFDYQMNRQVSGPHKLITVFKVANIFSPRSNHRRQERNGRPR
jgi:hypothetical protein